jgi:pimeloyl-ACP methyl ester carboxylesterase
MPEPRSYIIDGGPAPIHCLEWPGPGQPLFLIHGTTFCAAVWAPVAARLTERHRVIAMDLRGHGDSGKPADAYRTDDFVADILHVVDRLGIAGAPVLAHSLGANVALSAWLHRPSVFSRAVLIEPSVVLTPEHLTFLHKSGERFKGQSATKSHVWPDRETMFQAYRTKPIPSTWREDALRAYIEGGTRLRDDGRIELKCTPQIEQVLYSGQRLRMMTAEDLRRLTLPILLVRGERTPRALRSMVDEAAPLLPNAKRMVIPGATHFVPMETPEELARLTEEFVDGAG